jgi:SAM-dependent methyltransferase
MRRAGHCATQARHHGSPVRRYVRRVGASDDDRYQRERAFHDDRFSTEARPADRFYNDSIDRSLEAFLRALDALPAGAEALDYGCGATALAAIHLARRGQRVMAVDLSPVAIEQARARASSFGVADRIAFRVGNAEALDLPDESFDVVAGTGILHHLDLQAAYAEIARVIKPAGTAVFVEPLGHNPLINLYRKRTPEQRTPDEHPLLMRDFEVARRWFSQIELQYFQLTSLITLPLHQIRGNQRLIDQLDRVDRVLFRRVPVLGRYAWRVLATLTRS